MYLHLVLLILDFLHEIHTQSDELEQEGLAKILIWKISFTFSHKKRTSIYLSLSGVKAMDLIIALLITDSPPAR